MTNDTTKLPKWAQREIERKDREIESLKRQIVALVSESRFETVTAFVEPEWQGVKVPVAGDYQNEVTFLLKGQDPEDYMRRGGYISARVKDGRLLLHTHGRMVVRPTGGVNTLEIGVED